MKKILIIIIAITILVSINIVLADKGDPSGQPFQTIWNAMSGPAWDERRVSEIEDNISDLSEEISEIWEHINQTKECAEGERVSCNTGLLGVCAVGTKTCNQYGFWGACLENNQPSPELCDTMDNDCDGEVDEICSPIITDNFNNYSNGNIVNQGNWANYVNGSNFIIQDEHVIFEGAKSLSNSAKGDSVIVKQGNSLTDGHQTFYLAPVDRSEWGNNSFAQIRLTKGPWASGSPNLSFAAVTFEQDGRVGYSSVLGGAYNYFSVYNDNEWSKLEIEWRSSDNKARYRMNNETWTEWDNFPNSNYFTDFDYVGLELSKTNSSGSVYFDNLK